MGNAKWFLALMMTMVAVQAAPTVRTEAFFEGVRVKQVAISPEGRYLSLVADSANRHVVMVIDRENQNASKAVLAGDTDKRTQPDWCGWVNESRLLCGMSGVAVELGKFFPYSRLVSVNADGSDLKLLQQSSTEYGQQLLAQFQDQVIDWLPDDPRKVLIQLDDDLDGYPDVVSLDVYTGKRSTVVGAYAPIRSFVTDGAGNVRLGYGYKDDKIFVYAKLAGEKRWVRLSRTEAWSQNDSVFQPVAVLPNSNAAYAFKADGDVNALWKIDLGDGKDPSVAFSHPNIDVGAPLFSADGRWVGVEYETEKPHVYYEDTRLRSIALSVDTSLPATSNSIIGWNRSETLYLIKAVSDVASPAYYLLDAQQLPMKLSRIGSEYPAVDKQSLAMMTPINYASRDGTVIPGYLTVPAGKQPSKLPLVVMPHGGPIFRDSWGFDPWVQFLASRGYAVLQMNFRGSDGYGSEWYWSAHQDWGGVTYNDITDATRWAVKQGIADPGKICVVGASFGGYAALLSAARNSELYQCAISIAGVSDLQELIRDDQRFMNAAITRKQFSDDADKLKADSPRRLAGGVQIPILMIHGDHDYTVEVDHTKMMASALRKLDKAHEVVIVEGADHYFRNESDQRILFQSMERFLGKYLGASP